MPKVKNEQTSKYLEFLKEKYDEDKFKDFIEDLLNLKNENIKQSQKRVSPSSEQYKQYIESIMVYADYEDSTRRKIGVMIIKAKDNKNVALARTMQRNFVAHLLDHYEYDAAVVSINSDYNNTWRLSFVKKEEEIKYGKLNKKLSPAKRYSYLFGPDEPNHTAEEQLLTLLDNNEKQYTVDEIEEQFKVEKVTKEFFENYKENYLRLKECLDNNPDFEIEKNNCGFTSEEFAKKLMGQLVFLYFLQKKGWLGIGLVPGRIQIDEYENIYNNQDHIAKKILDKYFIRMTGGIVKIKNEELEKVKENEKEFEQLSDIFVHSKWDSEWGTGNKNFVRKIFEKSTNMNKNFFNDFLEPFFYQGLNHKRKNQYFSVFNSKVPFLNGGLFEPLDNYRWDLTNFEIDNDIFSNDKQEGILDFFDRYNFTINEEEPLEKDVAVDPEMLGKIFENLLDVKDRKSKGAFYTPREIVHYMCQESLINYIVNKCGTNEDETRDFVLHSEMIRDEDLKSGNDNLHLIGDTLYNNILEIDKALENIKVADPAVGSGAFPLGMLNEIVKLRNTITSYLEFKNKYMNQQFIAQSELESRTTFNIKRNTIKNCIYAVDIENSAVDITKLRLWLSIIVDQDEVPYEGPQPLPNLDFKIMQGNSLVDEFEGIKLLDEKYIDELKNRDNISFNSSSDKKTSVYQIELGDGMKKAQVDELIRLKKELFETKIPEAKHELLKKIQKVREDLLKLNFPNTKHFNALMLEDKSHNKPYFSWMLEYIEVFIENDGFDIVIGNPPYVKEYTDSSIFSVLKGNDYYQGKMDLWYFFGCYGIDLLNSQGVETFIAPNNWVTNSGASKLRNKILHDAKIERLIDFGNYKVFDSAGIQTMVYVLNKKGYFINNEYILKFKRINNDKISLSELSNLLYKDENDNNMSLLNYQFCPDKMIDKHFEFYNNEIQIVISHILDNNNIIYISEKDIAQGIVCPQDCLNKKAVETLKKYSIGDGVFVVTKQEMLDMCLNENERKYLKPYYTSENLLKWYGKEETNQYIIYTSKGVNNIIDSLPNIKKHLDKFSTIITSDNKPYGLHRARDERFFIGEKIIAKRKCVEPCFTYVDFDTYVSQTYNIIKTRDVNLKYLLGILNSSLIAFWLRYKGKMQGNNFQVDKEPICSIPIKVSNEYMNEMISLVDKQLSGFDCCKEINDLVYKIYSLNKEDINIIEGGSNA